MSKTVCQNTLPFHSHRNITARFDGGSLTSDAGWLLFGSLDRQHRLCEAFKNHLSMDRLSCHRFLANQFRLLLHGNWLTRCSFDAPARLSSRNPLAQARNRNLTSSGPQDWGPDPTNHSTHLGPSFLSLPRTTPLPPRLESPELQLAFPSSPEKPLPTLIQAQICLKFTPQTTQTPRQPIFFANPPVTPARFRVGPLLESFFNTELRFLHNPG